MRFEDFRHIKLSDPGYGDIRVIPVPAGDDGSWGVLEPLRPTVWGALITIVPGSQMAEARHGRLRPLMQIIGRPPEALLKLVPQEARVCRQATRSCGSFRPQDCHPCSTMPACYEPPRLPYDATSLGQAVAVAWRDGIYVVVVDGAEFSL